MKPVKIVIIGAGSASFGLETMATLLREPALRGSTLSLVDTNAQGLALIHRLAERMNREWDAGISIESDTDRRRVLDGADFVVCSIEVGPREELWRTDWEITLRHGLRQPYSENGGPGGFAHAARNIPHILDIARDMERLCPDALFVNLTNPLPRICRAVTKYTDINVVGLCHQIGHGYGMVGRLLADVLNVEPPGVLGGFKVSHTKEYWQEVGRFLDRVRERVDIKAAGTNHFTWMIDVRDRQTGEDLYPLLKERFLAAEPSYEPLTRDMLLISGLLPVPGDTHMSEYLHYTHNPSSRPWERYGLHLYDWDRAAASRDEMWGEVEGLVSNGATGIETLRNARSEGVWEVVWGVAGNANIYRDAVNGPNNGAIPGLTDHAIVETPGVISGLGVTPLHVGPLPPYVAELVRRETERVELVVEAAATGNREIALQALALDPTVDDLDIARAILDDYLTTHAGTLPQFHGGWQMQVAI